MLTRGEKWALATIAIYWLVGASITVGAIYVVAHFVIKYW
jgi:hypothetical protein